jgi:large subunit ribosomal protein L6
MSKIGNLPITIPSDIKVKAEGQTLTVTGPKGELSLTLPPKIKAKLTDQELLLERFSEDKQTKSNHGTFRAHLQNIFLGLTQGWQKELQVVGTGYRAAVEGNTLSLVVGFIKPVKLPIPAGLSVTVDQDNKITIQGIEKVIVGQFASNVRKVRKPDAYKGKGIRYVGEYVKLKPGKAVKSDAK